MKSLYYVSLYEIKVEGGFKMENMAKEEIRWQVVKAMLDEFPDLKQKVKRYVK